MNFSKKLIFYFIFDRERKEESMHLQCVWDIEKYYS